MYYINYREYGKVETADEFETMKEARDMLKEYNMCFTHVTCYISPRCTKEWRERS